MPSTSTNLNNNSNSNTLGDLLPNSSNLEAFFRTSAETDDAMSCLPDFDGPSVATVFGDASQFLPVSPESSWTDSDLIETALFPLGLDRNDTDGGSGSSASLYDTDDTAFKFAPLFTARTQPQLQLQLQPQPQARQPATTPTSSAGLDADSKQQQEEEELGVYLADLTTAEFKKYMNNRHASEHATLKRLRRRFRGRTYAANARQKRIAKHREAASLAKQESARAQDLQQELQRLKQENSKLRQSEQRIRATLARLGITLPLNL